MVRFTFCCARPLACIIFLRSICRVQCHSAVRGSTPPDQLTEMGLNACCNTCLRANGLCGGNPVLPRSPWEPDETAVPLNEAIWRVNMEEDSPRNWESPWSYSQTMHALEINKSTQEDGKDLQKWKPNEWICFLVRFNGTESKDGLGSAGLWFKGYFEWFTPRLCRKSKRSRIKIKNDRFASLVGKNTLEKGNKLVIKKKEFLMVVIGLKANISCLSTFIWLQKSFSSTQMFIHSFKTIAELAYAPHLILIAVILYRYYC